MTATEDHIRALLSVARAYYVDGQSQAEIARRIHTSRPTVSRLLQRARDLGVVQIQIGHPVERTGQVEAALTDRFGLRHAWVVDVPHDVDVRVAIAARAASLVPELVQRDSVVGVSNGTTLAAMVDALRPTRRTGSCVVQMIGSLGQDNHLRDSPDLCRRMSEALGGTCRLMPVPLVVRTSRVAAAMRREQSVSTTLALGSRPDVAFVGIGATDDAGSGHIFDGLISKEADGELRARGAVGHIVGHHFDRLGRHIPSELCARTIGVSLDRLTAIPLVVGVAGGARKVDAIRGAVAGGHVSGLVTDLETASALLRGDVP